MRKCVGCYDLNLRVPCSKYCNYLPNTTRVCNPVLELSSCIIAAKGNRPGCVGPGTHNFDASKVYSFMLVRLKSLKLVLCKYVASNLLYLVTISYL